MQATPSFFVREIPIYGDRILAPMDGFSDWPFRSLCRGLGSAMSYTEFLKADHITHKRKDITEKLTYEEAERPVVFQLYGDDPDVILEAALRVQQFKPDIIDINMGCPAKTVASRGAGVGLMRSPLKIARVFRKLTSALKIPITGKIRLGWDDCQNYKLIARIVEENGGALVAVHGRTKEQGYSGQANWDAIAEVRAVVNIPVIGNGDVKSKADIQRMKAYTGCAAVMIGRAAVGNPWIFSGLERERVSPTVVYALMEEHLKRNLAFYGEDIGLALFSKHAVQYVSPYKLSKETRTKLLTQKSPADFLALIREMQAG